MKFSITAATGAALLVIASAAFAQDQAAPAGFGAPAGKLAKLDRGFTRLFDGKSLDGWKMAGPGSFKLLPDGSMLAEGGMGLLWYTKAKYKDFELKLDWKALSKTSNSGVFVRFPDPGDDPWKPVNQGYEIQISDTGDDLHRTGAVYTFAPSTFVPGKPYGEWNSEVIKVVGNHYVVTINGKKVCDYVGTRSLEGYIGVQNHEPTNNVAFRNIRIKSLSR
ncbi:MAG TPA: DUF1080 domain-containing protein [Armatimonadota bacterium]|jgi:hypothetical protein